MCSFFTYLYRYVLTTVMLDFAFVEALWALFNSKLHTCEKNQFEGEASVRSRKSIQKFGISQPSANFWTVHLQKWLWNLHATCICVDFSRYHLYFNITENFSGEISPSPSVDIIVSDIFVLKRDVELQLTHSADIIWAMAIVRRITQTIIRTVLCCVGQFLKLTVGLGLFLLCVLATLFLCRFLLLCFFLLSFFIAGRGPAYSRPQREGRY